MTRILKKMGYFVDKSTQTAKNRWEIDNLPNRLTIIRLLLVPFIVVGLGLQGLTYTWALSFKSFFAYLSVVIFIIASLTDYVDGHLARKKNLTTVFGSFLDPIADKFLVVAALIMLLALKRVDPIIVIILILREFYVTSLRLLASDEGFSVPVDKFGKWKTATQMVAITLLMTPIDLVISTGQVVIIFSALLSVFSAVIYSIKLVRSIRTKRASS